MGSSVRTRVGLDLHVDVENRASLPTQRCTR